MRFGVWTAVLLAGCGGKIASSPDAPAKPDASTWSPSQLHLALWLEESGIEQSSNALSVWRDHSGTANDAVPAGAAQVLGQLLIQDTNEIRWGTSDFMIATVLRWAVGTAPSPPRIYFRSDVAETVLLGVEAKLADGNMLVGGAFFQAADGWLGPPAAQLPMSAFHIVIGRGNAPFELRVDDAVYTGPSSDVNCSNASPVSILALDGDVAELVVATGTTDDDETNLVAYFKAKFSL